MKSYICVLWVLFYSIPVLSEKTVNHEVSYSSSDNITVFADHHQQESKSIATIILFHQARGSAQGEYASIIPKLMNEGFNVLAVDLRNGGDLFGAPNRTVNASTKKDFNYCQAYPDLIASLNYVKNLDDNTPIFVWGSSYSAALVMKLSADYPNDIKAFLAFSPASGKPMGDCSPNDLADKITVKGLVARPDKEMEYPSAKAQFDMFKKLGFQMLIAKNGVHGSSMLVESRTKHPTEQAWEIVLEFLQKQVSS